MTSCCSFAPVQIGEMLKKAARVDEVEGLRKVLNELIMALFADMTAASAERDIDGWPTLALLAQIEDTDMKGEWSQYVLPVRCRNLFFEAKLLAINEPIYLSAANHILLIATLIRPGWIKHIKGKYMLIKKVGPLNLKSQHESAWSMSNVPCSSKLEMGSIDVNPASPCIWETPSEEARISASEELRDKILDFMAGKGNTSLNLMGIAAWAKPSDKAGRGSKALQRYAKDVMGCSRLGGMRHAIEVVQHCVLQYPDFFRCDGDNCATVLQWYKNSKLVPSGAAPLPPSTNRPAKFGFSSSPWTSASSSRSTSPTHTDRGLSEEEERILAWYKSGQLVPASSNNDTAAGGGIRSAFSKTTVDFTELKMKQLQIRRDKQSASDDMDTLLSYLQDSTIFAAAVREATALKEMVAGRFRPQSSYAVGVLASVLGHKGAHAMPWGGVPDELLHRCRESHATLRSLLPGGLPGRVVIRLAVASMPNELSIVYRDGQLHIEIASSIPSAPVGLGRSVNSSLAETDLVGGGPWSPRIDKSENETGWGTYMDDIDTDGVAAAFNAGYGGFESIGYGGKSTADISSPLGGGMVAELRRATSGTNLSLLPLTPASSPATTPIQTPPTPNVKPSISIPPPMLTPLSTPISTPTSTSTLSSFASVLTLDSNPSPSTISMEMRDALVDVLSHVSQVMGSSERWLQLDMAAAILSQPGGSSADIAHRFILEYFPSPCTEGLVPGVAEAVLLTAHTFPTFFNIRVGQTGSIELSVAKSVSEKPMSA